MRRRSPTRGPLRALAVAVGVALLALTGACDDDAPAPPAGDAGAGDGDGGSALRSLETLSTASDFTALEGEQWAVKYLAAVDGRTAPAPLDRRCQFQNTARYPLHIDYLRSFPALAQLDFD